ncbi:hypothetical protein [Paraburkholderia sp. 32]|uniref:hypothetical protein n=1 Tax=Paraburkholderia sp. 32 TaxID=2991057 RepID=UPI003D21E579
MISEADAQLRLPAEEYAMRDIRELMKQRPKVPKEIRERLRTIRDDWVKNHPKFKKAHEELVVHTAIPNKRRIALIIGPTSVGKSTLMRERDAELVQEAIDDGRPVRGSAYTELNPPNNGKIEVNALYTDVCNHFLLELVDYKIEYKPLKEGAPDVRVNGGQKATRAGMLSSMAKAAHGLHPAIFLDDASSWALLLKAGRAVEAPFVFNEIATKTKQTVVVSGGPEVACFQWMTGQMAARFRPIWMPPYYCDNETDCDDFASLLFTLEEELGADLIVPGTLQGDNADEIMRLTWGTFGIAIDVILVCVLASQIERKVLDWPMLHTDLLENFDARRLTMETEHRFFHAAQDEDRRAEYLGYLAHFQKRRKQEVAGEVSMPEMFYGSPSSDAVCDPMVSEKPKNAPGSLGSADSSSAEAPQRGGKGGRRGGRKPKRPALQEDAQ